MFGCSLAFYFNVLILISHLIQAQISRSTFQPIFKEDEHVRNDKSKDIRENLNLSVDPCEDFYDFACGNFQNPKLNRRKKNAVKTFEQILEEEVEKDLQFLLKEEVTLNDGVNGRKVKDFYKSCKNALSNDQQQQTFFSEFIKLNGGFPASPGSNWEEHHPNYEWADVVANLRYHYHMDILIGISIEANPFNLYEDTLYLTEPSTILPKDLCNMGIDQHIEIRRREYEDIEKNIASNLKSWLSIESPKAESIASSILIFEFELCRGMTGEMDNIDSENNSYMNYTRRTLNDFTLYFNYSMDFYKFVSRSYDMPFPRPVSMRSEQYYKNLFKTIAIHNKASIANYIMYRALSTLSFPNNKNTRSGFCIQLIKRYFPHALGAMYYYKFVASKTVKNDVEVIFEKIKIAFANSLRNDWIQEDTTRVGLSKLNDIVLHLPSYEEKQNLNNLSINASNYWHNLAQVMYQPRIEELKRLFATGNVQNAQEEIEAYDVRIKYRPIYKRIDMGWALLKSPFYHTSYPYSMLYAMIGQKLAQELINAFNDLGWTSDILKLDNWDHITALAYQNRSECFRKQISYYLRNDANAFQNITQLREMIAISAGVNIAFAAYLNWLDFLNPNNDFSILRKETLPELNFTNTQLFFIAYAQMYCHLEKKNLAIADACPIFKHSLERYKVNGPLWNSVEFGKEFRCLLGSEMNQADKCIIY